MKTTLYKPHILGISAALLMPFLASATGPTTPSGSYISTVTDPTNAVWDFGGVLTNLNLNATNGGIEAHAAIATEFTQSGKGKVNGLETNVPITLTLVVDSIGDSLSYPVTVTAKGAINSTKGGAHLVFAITATGIGTLPLETKPSKITLSEQINATINSAAQTISGTHKETASSSGTSVFETEGFTNTIAEVGSGGLGDGSWTLALNNLATTNNKVSGTATITLNSGQVFNYAVKGAFNATKGTKLVLSASDLISKGSAIQVTIDTNNVVSNIKGRITGQNVNVVNP